LSTRCFLCHTTGKLGVWCSEAYHLQSRRMSLSTVRLSIADDLRCRRRPRRRCRARGWEGCGVADGDEREGEGERCEENDDKGQTESVHRQGLQRPVLPLQQVRTQAGVVHQLSQMCYLLEGLPPGRMHEQRQPEVPGVRRCVKNSRALQTRCLLHREVQVYMHP
jgi:hypothetical protein